MVTYDFQNDKEKPIRNTLSGLEKIIKQQKNTQMKNREKKRNRIEGNKHRSSRKKR